MFAIPPWNGSLLHWVLAGFAVSAPLFFLGEVTGLLRFGYSKFANRGARGTVPSRWGMLAVYAPAVFVGWLPLLLRDVPLSPWHLLVSSLVSLHFLKRCLETLFLHRYSGVMNLGSVLQISALYTLVALLLGEAAATAFGPGRLTPPPFDGLRLLGLLLWVVGVAGNFYHHWLLANLRAPGDTAYKVPQGGLFRWVATPHYALELVGWWGFALLFHHVAAAIVAWTMSCYLFGRAHSTLLWYRERLGDQLPAGWKRIVPFVF